MNDEESRTQGDVDDALLAGAMFGFIFGLAAAILFMKLFS